jgi:peptidoglycan/LPS O-acetylase OafA/YrhL
MDRLPPKRHWPALDGLRAVAVIVVIIFHLKIPHLLPGGYVGVDVFFVLSGFLITSLLIAEWASQQGHISFWGFYIRRALRLFPALSCVIVAAAALAGIVEVAGVCVAA